MDNNREALALRSERAVATSTGDGYTLRIFGNEMQLNRGTDFDNPTVKYGKKAGSKAFEQPILLKAGAEKIAFAYGLGQKYVLESTTELTQPDGGKFLSFLVRCDLVKKLPDGSEFVLSNSYGEANTGEGRNGFKGFADCINPALKMAQKRALVGAALAISGLSDMFTQDIENESFMATADDIIKETPDQPITPAQKKRIFAIAAKAGLNTEQTKQKLAALGYTKTGDITKGVYDEICEKIGAPENAE